jgi:PTS system N-acetylgalactosamine-specific IID component
MLLQASFNYERMQASGWLYGLLPALKKIHTNQRDLARAMKGHMGFFNTHPFLVTLLSASFSPWNAPSRMSTAFRAPKLP